MNKLRLAFWAGLLAVAGGVVWVYAVPLSAKDRAGDAGRGVLRTALLGPEPERVQYDSFGPWEFGCKMPKTAVPGENLSCSFTLRQAIWVNMGGAGGYELNALNVGMGLGGVSFIAHYDDPAHPGEWGLQAMVQGVSAPLGSVWFWYETPVDPDEVYWIEIPCSIVANGDAATKLAHSTVPIGEKAATHAKECVLTETWFVPSGTTYTITVDGNEFSDTLTSDKETALSILLSANNIDSRDWVQGDNGMNPGTKYVMSIEDIAFGPVDIDTSAFAPTAWGTGTSENKLWAEGFGGNSIGFWASEYFDKPPSTYDTYTGGIISAPFSYDFSNVACKWMDGTAVDSALQVYCTGLRNLNGSGIDIGDWHGTLAALQALGRVTQVHGCYYWDSWEPDMQATVELYLDLTSAESLGIEVRGPQPAYKVEGAGWSGGVEWTEGYASPYDGPYAPYSVYNGETVYSNGYAFMYCSDPEAGDWAIGPGPPTAPYYVQSGGGPAGAYLVNTDSYDDDIIFAPSQRQFSGLAGEGIGPAVSASTEEAISVDSDCATPAFSHDATFIIDGWHLAATSRTASPYMTDVVSIAADAAKSVYADAHDHTDWVGSAGVTGPDADGYFTIPAGGGSLTLTLKCNRPDRLDKVGGVGQVAFPDAYRKRRHDACLGEGDPPETAEAVTDWRGRYLAQSFVLPSVPADLTCTVTYYDDLQAGSIGDNHKTDSTRQTEATHDEGDLYTLARTIPASYAVEVSGEMWSPILIDLYDEQNGHPIAMAVTLKWEFAEAGECRLSAPTLTPDTGDRQEITTVDPYYREAPSSHGLSLKVDESWRYAQGVVSHHTDGLCDRVLFVPDHAKACVVEKCFDTLNVLIGAKTGQDLTSNYSLAGWPVTNSGEAWTYTHNAANEAAYMTDAEDETLKALQVLDIAPQMSGDDIAGAAVRVFRMVCVNGLAYTFRGPKYVGGRAHGMVVKPGSDDDFPRSRGQAGGDLYRRHLGDTEDSDYALVEEGLTGDEHAHWGSASWEITDTDAARSLFDYAALTAGAYRNIGRFATREFALQEIVAVTLAHPFLREGACSRLYLVCSKDGTVHMCRLPYGMTWDDQDTAYVASGFAEWPCLAYHRPYALGALVHGTDAQVYRKWTGDTNDWADTADLSALGYSYPYADYGLNRGQVHVAGYVGGTHKLAAVDATSGAVAWQRDIAAGDDAPGALGIQAGRRQLVYAVPNGADLDLYWSIDDGETWTQGGTAAGLAYPSLDCACDGRFYLAGYAGGYAYCERWDYAPNFAIRGTRATVGTASEDRVCVARLRQLSQPVVVCVKGGVLVAYRSTDDGDTWTQTETVLT